MTSRITIASRSRFAKGAMAYALVLAATAALGCAKQGAATTQFEKGSAGTLMLVGGALDPENHAFYERFIDNARRLHNPPRIVICAVPSGEQIGSAGDQMTTMRAYCPEAHIRVIRRETLTEDAVRLIDDCGAVFITGGDQSRVTAKYRPDGVDAPEALALRRLLARNGTIAGTSAGCALMGDPMFTGGDSASALGIARPQRADPDDDASSEPDDRQELGPRLAPGMAFLPGVITDSHFFERDRIGRLVAAMEKTGISYGLGVGENACVEVELQREQYTAVEVLGGPEYVSDKVVVFANSRWQAVGPGSSAVVEAPVAAGDNRPEFHGYSANLLRDGDDYFYHFPSIVPPSHSARSVFTSIASGCQPVMLSNEQGNSGKSLNLFETIGQNLGTAHRAQFEGWSIVAIAFPSFDNEIDIDFEIVAEQLSIHAAP